MSVAMLDEIAVGRPKKQDRPTTEPLKPKTLGIRVSGEYAAWVDEFAKQERTDMAKLVDAALVLLAEHREFRPPPNRVP